jgi:hypothetical protein
MAWTTNSSNDGLSAIPSNGGTGFLAWTSSKTASNNAGYFLGDSTAGGGNVNVGGNAFAIYAHSGTNANAVRDFADPLATVGDFFFCRFTLNYRNGFKGIALRDGTNTNQFLFQAASDAYETFAEDGNGYINTGWGYTGSGIYDLRYTVNANTRVFSVTRDFSETVTRTISSSSLSISNVLFFIGNTDNGDSQNNLYFNSLSTFNPYR